jgi:Putative prokaryotic signal transducing protein
LRELVRTNDLVLISFIESLLDGAGLNYFVADRHMSAVEGSLGFLPRRILAPDEDWHAARRLLIDAGLSAELRDERDA